MRQRPAPRPRSRPVTRPRSRVPDRVPRPAAPAPRPAASRRRPTRAQGAPRVIASKRASAGAHQPSNGLAAGQTGMLLEGGIVYWTRWADGAAYNPRFGLLVTRSAFGHER